MWKTLAYLGILALLGAGIYFFMFRKNDNPFGGQEAGFNIKDTAAIGKIFIASSYGESVTVERKEGYWQLNGHYKALSGTVDMVLNTLVAQRALYPVTQKARENAVKLLATDAIKVELYDRANKKLAVFYVGGTSVNNSGTNMLMEGAQTPFVVQAPAFSGNLRPRYPTDIAEWRDRTVFNIPPQDIKKVSVQYNYKPEKSFVVTRDNQNFSVTPDASARKTTEPLNTKRAGIFFTYFANVNCEGYLNGTDSLRETISRTSKMSTIEVTRMNGTTERADIYWMPLNKRSKNRLTTDEETPNEYDADRMFAIINNNADTVQIQTLTFKKIFRQSAEFFEKDNAPKTVQVPLKH